MAQIKLLPLFAIIFLSVLILSCTKDPKPAVSKKVRYEITGNFSGKLLIVYSDNVNGTATLNNITLPWSKEISFSSNVLSVGIGAQASVIGVPGQKATLRIWINDKVVKSAEATAGPLGELVLATVGYTF